MPLLWNLTSILMMKIKIDNVYIFTGRTLLFCWKCVEKLKWLLILKTTENHYCNKQQHGNYENSKPDLNHPKVVYAHAYSPFHLHSYIISSILKYSSFKDDTKALKISHGSLLEKSTNQETQLPMLIYIWQDHTVHTSGITPTETKIIL